MDEDGGGGDREGRTEECRTIESDPILLSSWQLFSTKQCRRVFRHVVLLLHSQDLQTSMLPDQSHIDRLDSELVTVKQLVTRSRPGISRKHADVGAMESDVTTLTDRWHRLSVIIPDR